MRYISVYKKNNFLKRLFTIISLFTVLVPGMTVLIPLLTGESTRQKEPLIALLSTLGTAAVMALIMILVYRYITQLSVDVSDMGLHHLAPGREKTLLWQDVIEVKIVPYGKSDRAVRIKTSSQRYVFPPHLVPDSFEAPNLKMGFPYQNWVYPDGRKERADVLHSFGAKIVRQYRPDLAKGILDVKDEIRL
jgi:hypothetical protein